MLGELFTKRVCKKCKQHKDVEKNTKSNGQKKKVEFLTNICDALLRKNGHKFEKKYKGKQ